MFELSTFSSNNDAKTKFQLSKCFLWLIFCYCSYSTWSFFQGSLCFKEFYSTLSRDYSHTIIYHTFLSRESSQPMISDCLSPSTNWGASDSDILVYRVNYAEEHHTAVMLLFRALLELEKKRKAFFWACCTWRFRYHRKNAQSLHFKINCTKPQQMESCEVPRTHSDALNAKFGTLLVHLSGQRKLKLVVKYG